MILNDKNYNVLKWVVTIVLPALTALVGTVGLTLGYDSTDVAVTLMVAITTFLGATLGISNVNYKKEDK